MAMRDDLTKQVRDLLAKAGFTLSDEMLFRNTGFDIVARRDNLLLIVKVLKNVDSLDKVLAQQIKVLAQHLGAAPIVVGERTSSQPVEAGVVYMRHGVPIMSYDTLNDYFAEGVPPFIYAAPGGPYVNIDGEEMARLRKERGVSLGTLADAAGVSRKAIQRYEEGMSAVIEVALKLEERLGAPIVSPIDPFSPEEELGSDAPKKGAMPEGLKKEVLGRLDNIGFVVTPMVKTPVDAISRSQRHLYLTGVDPVQGTALQKARILANISRVTDRGTVVFMEREYRKLNVDGTPIVIKSELLKVDSCEDLEDLISERGSEPSKGSRKKRGGRSD